MRDESIYRSGCKGVMGSRHMLKDVKEVCLFDWGRKSTEHAGLVFGGRDG